MRRIGPCAAMILGLAGASYPASAWPEDITVTKAPRPATAATTAAACDSLWNFASTNCPLSWYGITVYGIVDMGVGWQSHGAPFNPLIPPGVEYLVSKNGNRALWGPAPNALSQSNVGIKGDEQFAPGWSFVFNLNAGFDPYSFAFANGPGSIAQNDGVPLGNQSSWTDSSRAGQFFNTVGYMGVSSPSYGTLTVFRQYSLTLDAVFTYDPMGASYAFSPIGYSGITCGVGDTEDCRFSTSLKYRVNIGQFRAAALWQFGGYDLNNAANGAYQFELGGDITNMAHGTLSLDAIFSHVIDAVSITGPLTAAQNAINPGTLPATISDDTSVMLLAKYTNGPLSLYGGYEYIDFAPPSQAQTTFVSIAGIPVVTANITNTAYDFHDRVLQVFWMGAKYALIDNLDLIGGYYHYFQNSYGAVSCSDASSATCSGTFDAVSFVVDWKFAAKFDAYAGFMFSQVNGGLANGYLYRNTIDPTAGLRFQF
jgi:predicted porin